MKLCAIESCEGKLTDNRQKYCVIHRYEAIRRNTYAFKKQVVRPVDVVTKLHNGFARQANLPEGAYPANFSSIGYYAKKAEDEKNSLSIKKVACPCHFRKNVTYDPLKYRGCYYCAVENFRCCQKREENEKKYG